MKLDVIKDISVGTTLDKLATKFCGGNHKKVGVKLKTLESAGFIIGRSATDSGEIKYSTLGELEQKYQFRSGFGDVKKSAILENTGNVVKTLIISDLHIGLVDDGMQYIEKIYEYAKANNIHVIISLGDLFQGIYQDEKSDLFDIVNKQLDRFMKKYPFEKDIANFVLLGNHDYTLYGKCHIDISRAILERPDVINLGYGIGKIRIGKSVIAFHHDLVFQPMPNVENDHQLLFKGHSHKFEISGNSITVPSLLNQNFYNDLESVGFLNVDFILDNSGYLTDCVIRHFDIYPDIKFQNEIYLAKIKKKI